MRLATWNVNGLRARYDFLLHWLKARQPDVVGLQELKTMDDKFPFAELEAEGYYAVVHGQKAWNGVAILTRKKAETIQIGLPGQTDAGARLVAANIDDLTFITVYCPNGKSVQHEDYPKKLDWFDSLKEYLDQALSPEQSIVLCGDFNICPEPIDSWDEEKFKGTIFHTDEERYRYQNIVDWGFTDIFRQQNPELQKFSWWDYRGGSFYKNQGLRIDFILATDSLVGKINNVKIDRDYRKKLEGMTASDHAPVFCDVKDL
jgi:exodeoxyribonuclease-3